MSNLVLTRSQRLSNESTFLPPAHFVLARVLAAMIIIGYAVATVPMVDDQGNPPLISSAFFAVLFSVYLFFSNVISEYLTIWLEIVLKDQDLTTKYQFYSQYRNILQAT